MEGLHPSAQAQRGRWGDHLARLCRGSNVATTSAAGLACTKGSTATTTVPSPTLAEGKSGQISATAAKCGWLLRRLPGCMPSVDSLISAEAAESLRISKRAVEPCR